MSGGPFPVGASHATAPSSREAVDRRRAEALAALDALVESAERDGPPRDLDGARAAFEALVALRDALAARKRAGEADAGAGLARANAALAYTWSGAIPMAGFRPGRLELARAALTGGDGGGD